MFFLFFLRWQKRERQNVKDDGEYLLIYESLIAFACSFVEGTNPNPVSSLLLLLYRRPRWDAATFSIRR